MLTNELLFKFRVSKLFSIQSPLIRVNIKVNEQQILEKKRNEECDLKTKIVKKTNGKNKKLCMLKINLTEKMNIKIACTTYHFLVIIFF